MSTDQLKRIDSKLTALLQEKKKPAKETWVKVGIITSLTGWNNEGMRKARLNGLIDWKKTDSGFWYLLESLDEQWKIKRAI